MYKAALTSLVLIASLGTLSTAASAKDASSLRGDAPRASSYDVFVDGAVKPRARQMTHWGDEAHRYLAGGDDRFPH